LHVAICFRVQFQLQVLCDALNSAFIDLNVANPRLVRLGLPGEEVNPYLTLFVIIADPAHPGDVAQNVAEIEDCLECARGVHDRHLTLNRSTIVHNDTFRMPLHSLSDNWCEAVVLEQEDLLAGRVGVGEPKAANQRIPDRLLDTNELTLGLLCAGRVGHLLLDTGVLLQILHSYLYQALLRD